MLPGEDWEDAIKGWHQAGPSLVPMATQIPAQTSCRVGGRRVCVWGGCISEKGKESLRISGFLRTVSTSSQNCLLRVCPQAPA